jgi:hypothetical protein
MYFCCDIDPVCLFAVFGSRQYEVAGLAAACFQGWRKGAEFTPLRSSFSLRDDDDACKLTLPVRALLDACRRHDVVSEKTYFRCVHVWSLWRAVLVYAVLSARCCAAALCLALIHTCVMYSCRPAESADLALVRQLNKVSPSDFAGTLADKNDFLLLACKRADDNPEKELIVGFINYYFMWYLPKGSSVAQMMKGDTPDASTPGGADTPSLSAVPTVYVAVLQSIKMSTHADAIAEGRCAESEPQTGVVLACLALQHAMHSGAVCVCVCVCVYVCVCEGFVR